MRVKLNALDITKIGKPRYAKDGYGTIENNAGFRRAILAFDPTDTRSFYKVLTTLSIHPYWYSGEGPEDLDNFVVKLNFWVDAMVDTNKFKLQWELDKSKTI